MSDTMFCCKISCGTAKNIPVVIYKGMIKFITIT